MDSKYKKNYLYIDTKNCFNKKSINNMIKTHINKYGIFIN